jgi:hypothetical protein
LPSFCPFQKDARLLHKRYNVGRSSQGFSKGTAKRARPG